ncbi:MAG: phage Gp37/Gp68 family protein, partial [Acidobacteria bacterium]|nr:phage Gp37/Gp68 family protein [Acidobacteriota bacterium]
MHQVSPCSGRVISARRSNIYNLSILPWNGSTREQAMGETKIEWAKFTFNPWIGCQKVSEACKNCYAEIETPVRIARSRGHELWGPTAERQRTSKQNWDKVLHWNDEAMVTGERPRVFCASLADVFESRPDLVPWRVDLLRLIEETRHLTWLLLTKRPENVMAQIEECQRVAGAEPSAYGWLLRNRQVWIGTTVENQQRANERLPHLLKIPASLLFLSCEPLFGAIDLSVYLHAWHESSYDLGRIGWVIAGGESGKNARPCHPEWVRGLRDQCVAAGVPFLHKQWGEYLPYESRMDSMPPFYETPDGHL